MSKFIDNNEFHTIILAALLHDIGKFWQRAGENLTPDDERIKPSCCPLSTAGDNKYTRQHVLFSGRFIREVFKCSLAENIVLYHHLPDGAPQNYKKLVKIISLSDWLSSGERRDAEEEEQSCKMPLISIFSRLSLNNRTVPPHYVPLLPFNLDLTPVFPRDNISEALKKDSYFRLWNDFREEAELLKNLPLSDSLICQLLYLLQKFTLTIPAAVYKNRPDVSLYHHLKSTAAIASCLWFADISESELDTTLNAIRNSNYANLQNAPCILLTGDISGIQDFIYSVTSEAALKGIKGRSFYLQLLCESIAKCILRNLELTDCNIIYIGGGNFNILLPNTEKVQKEVQELIEIFGNNLFKAHRGRLALNIAYRPIKYLDFLDKRFGEIWSEVKMQLAEEKRRKFSMFLKDKNYIQMVLGPYEEGGERPVCEICGEELDAAKGDNKCPLCNSFADLAYEIPRAQYISVSYQKPKKFEKRASSWNEVLEANGCKISLVSDIAQTENFYLINNTDFLNEKRRFLGFQFFAQNAPRHGEQVKTLEELAEGAKGVKKWGIIRADVDNLGRIFAEGLGEEDRTISRVSMLSEMISLFFNAHLENIARSNQFKDRIYLIYSGGDDLFAIGAWSTLPDFAQRLYDDFRKYTAQNLTLSASIYIAPTVKFPIYQTAANAGEALDMAKKDEKNKLSLLETPIIWDNINELREIKDEIVRLLDREGPNIPRALLQILYYGWIEKQRVEKGMIPMVRIWRFLYAMKRLKERHRNYAADIDALEKRVMTQDRLETKQFLEVAVRWSDLLTRKEE